MLNWLVILGLWICFYPRCKWWSPRYTELIRIWTGCAIGFVRRVLDKAVGRPRSLGLSSWMAFAASVSSTLCQGFCDGLKDLLNQCDFNMEVMRWQGQEKTLLFRRICNSSQWSFITWQVYRVIMQASSPENFPKSSLTLHFQTPLKYLRVKMSSIRAKNKKKKEQ